MSRLIRAFAVLSVTAITAVGLTACGTDTVQWEPVTGGQSVTYDGAAYQEGFTDDQLQNLPVNFDQPGSDNPVCTAGFGGSFTLIAKSKNTNDLLARYKVAPEKTQKKILDFMGPGTKSEPTIMGDLCEDGAKLIVQDYIMRGEG